MEKIRLTTSGLPIDGRRAAAPDMDHAVKILEMTERGYHVAAKCADSIWTVHFYLAKGTEERPAFINLPPGVTSSLQIRPYKGSDDGRLYDDQPEWITKLVRLVDTAAPPHIQVLSKEQSDG